MKRITIGSPDKISLKMFTNFLIFCLGKDYEVGNIHYLMTPEAQEVFVSEFDQREKVIFLYFSRKKATSDSIPDILTKRSEVVVWFDRYSVDPKILKDDTGFEAQIMNRWKLNIERMAKMDGK